MKSRRVIEPDTIDTLALKHLRRHPNDKSERYLAKMNRRYGKQASSEALQRMKTTAKLMGMELPAERGKAPLIKFKPSGTASGRSYGKSILNQMQAFPQRMPPLRMPHQIQFLDEYVEVDTDMQKLVYEMVQQRMEIFNEPKTLQASVLPGTKAR